jgi:hypothetical protein
MIENTNNLQEGDVCWGPNYSLMCVRERAKVRCAWVDESGTPHDEYFFPEQLRKGWDGITGIVKFETNTSSHEDSMG